MSSSVANPRGQLEASRHANQLPSRSYRFGNVEVDFRFAEVRRSGVRIRIQDQPLHILAALLSRPGEIVSREELRKLLWDGDTFVDFDHCLNSAVKRLRDVLHDDPDHPCLIETIPRHGYRFIAPVTEIEPVASSGTAARDDTSGPLILPGQEMHAKPETAGDRGPAIVQILIVLLSVVAATVAISLFFRNAQARANTAVNQHRITIVVLPLHDLSADGSGTTLAAGMTQELITQLHKLDHAEIGVLADAPVGKYHFAEHPAPLESNGHKADYIIEGSTSVQGSAVRFAVQLVRVGDQSYVWAESYDKVLGDPLTLQRDVATEVTRAVREKLSVPHPADD